MQSYNRAATDLPSYPTCVAVHSVYMRSPVARLVDYYYFLYYFSVLLLYSRCTCVALSLDRSNPLNYSGILLVLQLV
jgi:hypothetical protein